VFFYNGCNRRFGFANPEALAAGQTGTDCRGEEHDITFVWSLTSGKRLVLADGQEVHYSNSRSNLFDFSWTMKGNNVLKIVAHGSPPMTPTPGFRQYDFFVNGQSFFTFPKVFRLGLSTGDPRGVASPVNPARMAESNRGAPPPRRLLSGDIAALEAPGNPDEVCVRFKYGLSVNLFADFDNFPSVFLSDVAGGGVLA
jgi:hypothetical protein